MDNFKKKKMDMNFFKKFNSVGFFLVKIFGYRDWYKIINEIWIVYDVFFVRKKSWFLILDVGLCDGEYEIFYL